MLICESVTGEKNLLQTRKKPLVKNVGMVSMIRVEGK